MFYDMFPLESLLLLRKKEGAVLVYSGQPDTDHQPWPYRVNDSKSTQALELLLGRHSVVWASG